MADTIPRHSGRIKAAPEVVEHDRDHRLGGIYIEWNLQALCGSCNSRKGGSAE